MPFMGERRRTRTRSWRQSPVLLLVAALPVLVLSFAGWLIGMIWSLVFDRSKPKPSGGKSFRDMPEWKAHFREVRAIGIRTCDRVLGPKRFRCVCCCGDPFPTVSPRGIHWDHIKPVATHPELSFRLSNHQPMCETCNLDKSHHPALVSERRPDRLIQALELEERRWLRKHGGVDPVHALYEKFQKQNGTWREPGQSWWRRAFGES